MGQNGNTGKMEIRETLKKFENWFEKVTIDSSETEITFYGRYGKTRSAQRRRFRWFYSGKEMEDLEACIRKAGMDLD